MIIVLGMHGIITVIIFDHGRIVRLFVLLFAIFNYSWLNIFTWNVLWSSGNPSRELLVGLRETVRPVWSTEPVLICISVRLLRSRIPVG